MKNRAERTEEKQTGAIAAVGQLLLPMIAGIARSKQALLEWVHQVGLAALAEVFEHDATQLAGPRGKHHNQRSHYRWGSSWSELPFGGRWIRLRRPRLRATTGAETQLPSLAQFRGADPVPAKVLNQILLGVSTRGYQHSLDPTPAGIAARGASKSAASRHLITRVTEKLRNLLTRRLDEFRAAGLDARWTADCAPHRGGGARHRERRAQSGAGPVAGLDRERGAVHRAAPGPARARAAGQRPRAVRRRRGPRRAPGVVRRAGRSVEWSSGAVPLAALRPLTVSPLSGECRGRADLRPVSTAPSSVGSRTGARAIGGGFPATLFR